MAANCSADIQAVIAHFDETFSGTNTTAINELKATFGMGDLTHLDDVVTARTYSIMQWRGAIILIDSSLSEEPA